MGIHLTMGYFLMSLLVWIGTDSLWQHWCACSRHICSEILLLLSLQSPPLLPSVPFSLLICNSPPRREDCVWAPEAEEGSPGAGPQREDPTSAWTRGATARTHTAPGEPWVNTHPHAHTQAELHTCFFYFPSNLFCSFFDLTSLSLSFPQALPLSHCQLMSSKMTSRHAPLPHPRSNMAFTNHRPFLHCQGSQVTNYWVTSQLWARPLTTAPVMFRWGNNTSD